MIVSRPKENRKLPKQWSLDAHATRNNTIRHDYRLSRDTDLDNARTVGERGTELTGKSLTGRLTNRLKTVPKARHANGDKGQRNCLVSGKVRAPPLGRTVPRARRERQRAYTNTGLATI